MSDRKDSEIVFSFAPAETMDGRIHQGHLTELWERGTTVVNGEVVTNIDDLRRQLRTTQNIASGEGSSQA